VRARRSSVSTSALTWARAARARPGPGEERSELPVRVRGGTSVSRRAAEAASLCPAPGRVKRTPRLLPRRRSRRHWGARRALSDRTGVTVCASRRPHHRGPAARSGTASSRACPGTAGGPSSPSPQAPRRRPRGPGAARSTRARSRREPARRILSEYRSKTLFHLAALLSTRASSPHHRRTRSTSRAARMLDCQKRASRTGGPSFFLYRAQIRGLGLPDLGRRRDREGLKEDDWKRPFHDVPGCNKLYCEAPRPYTTSGTQAARGGDALGQGGLPRGALPRPHLGGDGAFRRARPSMPRRCCTAAAPGRPRLLVAPRHAHSLHGHARGVEALLRLAAAPKEKLTRTVYNVGAFNPRGGDPRPRRPGVPRPEVTWARTRSGSGSGTRGQPSGRLRRAPDWARPATTRRSLSEYLVPTIRERYASAPAEPAQNDRAGPGSDEGLVRAVCQVSRRGPNGEPARAATSRRSRGARIRRRSRGRDRKLPVE